MRIFHIVFIALTIPAVIPHGASAKDIILHAGESYSSEDVNVLCVEQKNTSPLTISQCQIWDDFGENCLYEKKILSVGNSECIVECQHWDAFNKVCKYETGCRYYPDHATFVHKTCEEYDAFASRCRKEKEEKITD